MFSRNHLNTNVMELEIISLNPNDLLELNLFRIAIKAIVSFCPRKCLCIDNYRFLALNYLKEAFWSCVVRRILHYCICWSNPDQLLSCFSPFSVNSWDISSVVRLLNLFFLLATMFYKRLINTNDSSDFPGSKIWSTIFVTARHLLSQSDHLLKLHQHVIIDDIKPGIMLETATATKDPRGIPYRKPRMLVGNLKRTPKRLRVTKVLFWGRGWRCFSPLKAPILKQHILSSHITLR